MNPIGFVRSLKHALRGIAVVVRSEPNFRLQLLAAVIVLLAAIWFSVAVWEFILLLLLAGAVLVLELFNSVIERLADGFSPRLQPMVRDIKDLMAGAVLLVAIIAVIVGIMIFLPHLLEILR